MDKGRLGGNIVIQVKEFLNYQEAQEKIINDWLKEMDGKIVVNSIQYSVSAFQPSNFTGCAGDAFSGVLIIYREI